MAQRRTKRNKFQARDLVLAKMHGFPAWPSFVMPEDMIPPSVWDVKKKTTDYCVIFIPDGDYYWMSDKNLEHLSEEDLVKRVAKIPKKSKKQKGGGKTTSVGDALLATQGLNFDDYMERLGGDYSEGDNTEDINKKQEDAEDEENEPERSDEKSSIKSKRKAEPDDDKQKLTKALKTNSASTPPSKISEKKSDEKLTLEERRHQLWLCRIKLQRSLIQRNQPATPTDPKQFPPPTADELSVARLILHRLSDFPINLDLLKKTKIHKVLKCILRDEDLAFPDSFKLHEKCNELLKKWTPFIDQLKMEKQNGKSTSIIPAQASRKSEEIENDDSEVSAVGNVSSDQQKKDKSTPSLDPVDSSVHNDVPVLS